MSEWIKCSERFPEKEQRDKDIIVLIGKRLFLAKCMMLNTYYYKEPGSIIFDLRTEKWIVESWYKDPTHWMPLPEAPDA